MFCHSHTHLYILYSLLFGLRVFIFDSPAVASAVMTESLASLVLVGAVLVDVDTSVTARVKFDATRVVARSLVRAFAIYLCNTPIIDHLKTVFT